MSRYILSPEARQDLLEIRDYVASDSPDAARRVVARLKAACVYRPSSIVRVLHGARDLTSLF